MKSVTINHHSDTNAHSRARMNSLMNLMTNDNYLFLDSSMKLVEYSKSAIDLLYRILNKRIEKNALFLEQLVDDKEIARSLALFLMLNVQNEIIVVTVILKGRSIRLHISKVYHLQKHIGYNCLVEEDDADNVLLQKTYINYLDDLSKSIKNAMRIFPLVIKESESNLSGDRSELYTNLKADFQVFEQRSGVLLSLLIKLSKSQNITPSIFRIEPRFTDIKIKNILVLDEDKSIHVVIQTIIKSISPKINVLSFISAEEASEFIHTHPTDLVILDPQMSTSSGWNFLEVLSGLALNTPVLLSPASSNSSLIEKICQHKQIKGIVNKPITKKSFLNILNF